MSASTASMMEFLYQGKQVRTVVKDGEPWWVVKDACDVLEIQQPTKAVGRLDPDEVNSIHVTDSLGRQQETLIVNEPGLYSLILGSRKPEAKAFKRWITHDVIPAIRKTGTYSVQPPMSQLEILAAAAQALVVQERMIKDLDNKVTQASARIDVIEQRAKDAEASLQAMPAPSVMAPALEVRAQIRRLVVSYADKNGADYRKFWNMLYTEFRDRCHIDLKRQARNRNITPIERAEALGELDRLYAVAHALYGSAVPSLAAPTTSGALPAPCLALTRSQNDTEVL